MYLKLSHENMYIVCVIDTFGIFLVIAIHMYLHIVDFMQHEYFAIWLCSYMFDISHHALLNSICNVY
jgi:hypothetical protein